MNQSRPWQIPLYVATLFLAALLLFGLQPMVVRMILPAMGGSPAVWTTAQVFFQALLLAGYIYAHLLSRMQGIGKTLLIHFVVLALALTLVPIALSETWQPDINESPIFALLAMLALTVGPPFFAIATTAPLMQHWFSRSGNAQAANPYFLYSASNLGGLAALISYPFVIEPLLGLRAQGQVWGYGFALLAVLIASAGIGLFAAHRRTAQSADASHPDRVVDDSASSGTDADADTSAATAQPITLMQRVHWTVLAFVPSSLMLGVTLHISTDIAAMPFLWLLPLALYLLTWVITFARSPLLPHRTVLVLQPIAMVMLVLVFDTQHLALVFVAHLSTFFLCAMMCHGELARTRPPANQLTEFYLWLSVGGLLGGVFNAIVAPTIFNGVWEYPIALVLAALLRPALATHDRPFAARALRDIVLAVLLGLAFFGARWQLDSLTWTDTQVAVVVISIGMGLLFWAMHAQRLRFAVATAALLVATHVSTDDSQVLAQSRGFFGVHRLVADASNRYVMMTHGDTVHGLARRNEAGRPEPLAYYIKSGPVGRVLQRMNERAPQGTIGIVGMGPAAISCLATPTQQLTYFEIDSIVVDLANDHRHLTFMKSCGDNTKVSLGDGRRLIEDQVDRHFDMLVLDAFSSDAIPVHLLTREALSIFSRKLAPGGVMLVHLSNRHLDLVPVTAATALSAGLTYRVQLAEQSERTVEYWPSTWMLIGNELSSLEPFLDTGKWVESPHAVQPWTDDYSDIAAAIRWDTIW